jgi:hypothetical protein
MSAVETLARAGLAWVVLGTVARADVMEQNAGSTWYFYNGGSSGTSLGSFYANAFGGSNPASSTAPPSGGAGTISSSPVSAPIQTSGANGGGSSAGTSDAVLNFGSASYLEASQLTTGNPQAWYNSPSVEKIFGGQAPNSQQQSDFTNQVLQDVQQTFALSGLHPNITLDPNARANHMLSVVSGASYGPNGNAIGITDVGNNGFGFIDKLSYANSLTDLEWAVAHNISHELMHAFGVGVHYDQTGKYLDSGTATWDLLTDPNTTFSSQAAQAMSGLNFSPNGSAAGFLGSSKQVMNIDGDQEILAATVPEPATVGVWSVGLAGVILVRRRSRGRVA